MDMGVGVFVLVSAMVSPQAQRAGGGTLTHSGSSGSSSGSSDDDDAVATTPPARHTVNPPLRARRPAPTPPPPSPPPPPAATATAATAWHSPFVALAPHFVMGGSRLVSVARLNYQNHVSEYGRHWNYSFTAIAIALLAAAAGAAVRALRLPVSATAYLAAGGVVAALYQVALRLPVPATLVAEATAAATALPALCDHAASPAVQDACWMAGRNATAPMPLQDWVLHAPRGPSFLAANREGVVGIVGCFALYLVGVGMGRVVAATRGASATAWQRRLLLFGAAGVGGAWLVAAAAAAACGPVSRRLVNLPYIAWVVAHSATQLACLAAVEAVTLTHTGVPPPPSRSTPVVAVPASLWRRAASCFLPPAGTPFSRATLVSRSIILDAMNDNYFALFLVANLATTAVNHTMRTLDVPHGPAMAILLVHAVAMTATAVAWRRCGLRLKVW